MPPALRVTALPSMIEWSTPLKKIPSPQSIASPFSNGVPVSAGHDGLEPDIISALSLSVTRLFEMVTNEEPVIRFRRVRVLDREPGNRDVTRAGDRYAILLAGSVDCGVLAARANERQRLRNGDILLVEAEQLGWCRRRRPA